MTNHSRLSKIPWWVWFLSIDVILIVTTILWPHLSGDVDFVGYGFLYSVVRHLDLSFEMNAAVWWTGMVIFIAGMIAYELFSEEDSATRFAWLSLSVVFVGLSFDEMSSIHERIFQGWTIPLIVILTGALVLVPVFWHLIQKDGTRPTGVMLLGGLALMASAVPQEYLEHSMSWSSSMAGIRAGIEEGAEMLGALLCLYALVKQRRRFDWPNEISRVVPNPFRMSNMRPLIYGSLAVHVVITTITVTKVEIGYRGNPAVFIPSVVFVMLLGACVWRAFLQRDNKRWWWTGLGGVFGVASLFSFYPLTPNTVQSLSHTLRLAILSVYFFGVAAATLFVLPRPFQRKGVPLFVTITLVVLTGYVIDHAAAGYIAAGLVAVLLGDMVLRQPVPEVAGRQA